jgi:hypothetical protein
MDRAYQALSALLLLVGMLTPEQTQGPAHSDLSEQARQCQRIRRGPAKDVRQAALPFTRTELYFGAATPDGIVTEETFRAFIDEHVAPLFPDGLTVIKAEGRFRADNDTILKEQSFVLVLLYPCHALAEGSRRIDGIRALYKERFAQDSVLRVDDPEVVWVSY